jgi:hypothetical protein
MISSVGNGGKATNVGEEDGDVSPPPVQPEPFPGEPQGEGTAESKPDVEGPQL